MNESDLLRSDYFLFSEDVRSFRNELQRLNMSHLKKILRDYSENNVYSIWEFSISREFIQHILSRSDRNLIGVCIMFILNECGCIYEEEWGWAATALQQDLEKYQLNNEILFDPTLWEDIAGQ